MEPQEEVIADSEGEDDNVLEDQLHSINNATKGKSTPSVPYSSLEASSANIAERAKLRLRNPKPQVLNEDVIELSSDSDDLDLITPPTKTKREEIASKSQEKKSRSSNISASVHKPRPRPRPILKPQEVAETSELSSSFGFPTYQQETPAPSSSSVPDQFPIPFHLLPPKSPPLDLGSSTTNQYDLPAIETLAQINTDGPSSSQSSLFSLPDPRRKRRRVHPTSPFVDELDADQPPTTPGQTLLSHVPPSTFFAGSSSPPTNLTLADTDNEKRNRSEKATGIKKRKKKENSSRESAASGRKLAKKPKAVKNRVEVVIERQTKGKGTHEQEKALENQNEGIKEPIGIQMDNERTRKRRGSSTSLSSLPESDAQTDVAPSRNKKRKDALDKLKTGKTPVTTDQPTKRAKTRGKPARQPVSSDNEDEAQETLNKMQVKPSKGSPSNGTTGHGDTQESKESLEVASRDQGGSSSSPISKENTCPPDLLQTPAAPKLSSVRPPLPYSSLASRYTIAPKTKTTPMSDLIRHVNSLPGSPFRSPAPHSPHTKMSTAYSPYLKSSRSALSRIAPLHPNRRTPPPPPPPPPPRKKTKKEVEREEKWEEELVESVGLTEWACMSDAERAQLRRAKRESEMAGWDD